MVLWQGSVSWSTLIWTGDQTTTPRDEWITESTATGGGGQYVCKVMLYLNNTCLFKSWGLIFRLKLSLRLQFALSLNQYIIKKCGEASQNHLVDINSYLSKSQVHQLFVSVKAPLSKVLHVTK